MPRVQNEDEQSLLLPEKLDALFKGRKQGIILLHDNPDPDAIASSFALKLILQHCYALNPDLVYGGLISRAENRAMVQILKISLKKIHYVRWEKYDLIILIDTQPGAGNNSLPQGMKCHLVIDHHPRRNRLQSNMAVIYPGIGATATIMVNWLMQKHVPISSNLATALAYAIRSETQDLGRENSPQDVEAYLTVFPQASMRTLAHIAYPRLSDDYFKTLSYALERSVIYGNIMCIHIGEIPYPEITAEIADLFLRRRRTSWCLCTGKYKSNLYLSLRASSPGADAGRVIKKVVPDKNMAGGHNTFAGGRIALESGRAAERNEIEKRICLLFAGCFGYKEPDWKPLLGETED